MPVERDRIRLVAWGTLRQHAVAPRAAAVDKLAVAAVDHVAVADRMVAVDRMVAAAADNS